MLNVVVVNLIIDEEFVQGWKGIHHAPFLELEPGELVREGFRHF